MNEQNTTSYISTLKRALLTIEKMETKLCKLEREKLEPIAIVGMSCRFPGNSITLSEFWNFNKEGRDAIQKILSNRWQQTEASKYPGSQWGGFIEGIDLFDADFFQISPREADSLDPQQRFILELTWEALENACQPVEPLMGSPTGVFIGTCTHDYEHRVILNNYIDSHAATGNAISTVAGRIAYSFGLQGPCLVVDTACSSSLVATHLACTSLRNDECNLAIVGGVNLMTSPLTAFMMSVTQALSPDGRCRAFDARANGYVRGEGCGILILKRLSDAQKNNDRIWATIRGSAVNQDGKSTGLTTPNVLSQQALLRQALKNARVTPKEISYIETHGTGTPLGDPIEFEALREVLGQIEESTENKCLLGSVKTNIGHLEAAAGVAGIIKTVLAMHHECIPKLANFQTLNPRISLQNTRFVIPTQNVPWQRNEATPRIAGVSSFGISGTNAHVILQEAPVSKQTQPQIIPNHLPYILPISAKSRESLTRLVSSYQLLLQQASNETSSKQLLHDIVYTASVHRSHLSHRLVALGNNYEQLQQKLLAFKSENASPGLLVGYTPSMSKPRAVFIFAGHGSQWVEMGKSLFRSEPKFREAIELCNGEIKRQFNWSPIDYLYSDQVQSYGNRIDRIQPLLFAVEIALANLWQAWGVTPDIIVGHSMGEVAAAYIAGALSIQDAVRIICSRSNLLNRVNGNGAMAVVELSIKEASKFIEGYENHISIAVSNSPRSTVLSGETKILNELLERLETLNIFCRRIKVDVAFHSPQMDTLTAELQQSLTEIQPLPASIPIYSTVTEQLCNGTEFTPEYWAQNLRKPVRFSQVIQRLFQDGCSLFIEISPHPILLPAIETTISHHKPSTLTNQNYAVVPSIRREQPEYEILLESLGTLYVHGFPVEWSRLFPHGGTRVSLPNYAWNHKTYWLKTEVPDTSVAQNEKTKLFKHPLLGRYINSSLHPKTSLWEQEIDKQHISHFTGHHFGRQHILPLSVIIEMAKVAGQKQSGTDFPCSIKHFDFQKSVTIPEQKPLLLQLAVQELEGQQNPTFKCLLSTHQYEEEADISKNFWDYHAAMEIEFPTFSANRVTKDKKSLGGILARCRDSVSTKDVYATLQRLGIVSGDDASLIQQVWNGKNEALARIAFKDFPQHLSNDLWLSYTCIEACLQFIYFALEEHKQDHRLNQGYKIVHITEVHFFQPITSEAWAHLNINPRNQDDETVHADVQLLDSKGQVMIELTDVQLQPVLMEIGVEATNIVDQLFAIHWLPSPLQVQEMKPNPSQLQRKASWLLICQENADCIQIQTQLESWGEPCIVALHALNPKSVKPNQYFLNPSSSQDFNWLLDHIYGRGIKLRGIIFLHNPERLSSISIVDEATHLSLELVKLAQAVKKSVYQAEPPRVWLVTSKTQPIEGIDTSSHLSSSPAYGFVQVFALEHPEFRCTWIDIESFNSLEDTKIVVQDVLTDSCKDTRIAIRNHQRFTPRIIPLSPQNSQPEHPPTHKSTLFRADATYLLVSSNSQAGIPTVRWMVTNGATRVVLFAAELSNKQKTSPLIPFHGSNAQLLCCQVDSSDVEELTSAIQKIPSSWPELRGVFYIGNLPRKDPPICEIETDALAKKLHSRLIQLWNLHVAVRHQTLDFFFIYASASAVLGHPNYTTDACFSAFANSLALQLRQQGIPATCIHWGAFNEHITNDLYSSFSKLGGLAPEDRFGLVRKMLDANLEIALATPLDVETWYHEYSQMIGQSLFQDLQRQQSIERMAHIQKEITLLFLETIRSREQNLDPDIELSQFGIDSIMAIEFFRKIEQKFAFKLKISEFSFEKLSIRTLAHQLQKIFTKSLRTTDLSELPSTKVVKTNFSEVTSSSTSPISFEPKQTPTIGTTFPSSSTIVSLSKTRQLEVATYGSGEPLVLLLPIYATIPIWKYQFEAFSQRYRVITFNYPGYGQSTMDFEKTAPHILAEHLSSILDFLKIRSPVHLVGWSLGGMVAQEFALHSPDYLRSLTLVNTTAHLEEEDSFQNAENLLKILVQDFKNNFPQARIADFEDDQKLLRCDANIAMSLHYAGEPLRFDARLRVHEIRIPTIVISGNQDVPTPPRYGRFLAQQIRGARYYEVESAGHYVPLHKYETFNRMLSRFLAESSHRAVSPRKDRFL